MAPSSVERRARWVLDTIGAGELGLGDDVPYREGAWEQVERGERPVGDGLAEAFYHLARLEERRGARDEHGRFPGSATCLDPLDPPLERLRSALRLEPRPWGGARFAVALTMDVDVPWRWTRRGFLGSLARLKQALLHGNGGAAGRELRGLAALPLHKLRKSDPYWRFESIMTGERKLGVRSTFFLLAGHRHAADGPSPESYERLRARLVETLRSGGAEIGLHGSYTAAEDEQQLAAEAQALHALAGELDGHRYHYLRVDPHRNLRPLDRLGFRYDTSLGFADRIGFRAGIAHPFRPWDFAADRPLDLVEIPLAVMDATLAEQRYMGLTAAEAEPRLEALLDRAAASGGAFSVLWHPDRFDPAQARGWDRLYFRLIGAIRERGGVCVTCEELAAEAASRLPPGATYSEAPRGPGDI
jgi:peptidoglycan/xylan/chitin deacetylase (PgdA/CDA1 family)